MSQLAAEYNAINLSQGFPNFPVETINRYCCKLAKENVHQYAYVWLCTVIIKNSDTSQTLREPFSRKRNY
jgi:hypothetical protein